VGGTLGILIGAAVATLVRTFVPSIPATLSYLWIAIGFTISVSVGVFFGYYPANLAANLDPIDCCATNSVQRQGDPTASVLDLGLAGAHAFGAFCRISFLITLRNDLEPRPRIAPNPSGRNDRALDAGLMGCSASHNLAS